ncbi:MAG: glycosyl hydrolase [Chlorobi bacterium OLB4]|jgi:Uncharacterized protein related to plant photosystem II stability/assembly factor|nr:MAG: glycosyl hydrolase [Chlorobi bacterium OLB4]MBW7854947.1 T9SS type A sorting domain-containing protein [Ignavibacteria bacterium]OQY76868.1 MAG: hypothetical protein B6D43_09615 [Ignavibacteriales bacterium UTCHB1]
MKYIVYFLFPFLIIIALLIFFNSPFEAPVEPENQSTQQKPPKPKKGTQGNTDNPFAAAEYRYQMISTTTKTRDKFIDLIGYRLDAVEYTKENLMPAGTDFGESISWVAKGPGNVGGRIRSIIIHPTVTSRILIGAVSGGVWKTTDGGASWDSKLDAFDPIAIGSMVIDPTDPDIVYAGTGEGWGNGDAVYGGGIYKSTNFGDTWTLLSSTTSSSFRNVLKMAADVSGNIYAATKNVTTKQGGGEYTLAGGLFKSTDDGGTWSKISSTDFSHNYFNPTDVLPYTASEILYAVNNNGGTYGGIYRTTDGGTTWSKVTSGLPLSGYRRITLAQDPSHNDTVYAVFESTDKTPAGDAGLKGIYKSTNRGVSWSSVTDPPKISSTGSLSYLGTQGWYDNIMAVDPFDPDNLFVGGVDMMKSTNGGSNWSQLTYWHSYYGTPVVHADHHFIAFDPVTSGTVYSGNDGGIYKSTNSGVNWTSLNTGLEITQFYSGAISSTGSTVYGGTQDNGHLKFTSGTDWDEVFGGDGGYSAVDQTDASVAYEEYVYLEIAKTTNGGSNWITSITGLTDATDPSKCLFIAPFSMNPDNSDVLVAGSDNVWITSNGATSWNASSGTLSSGEFVSAVTVVKPTANFMGFAGTTDGKIFKCSSLDPAVGIDTWTDISPVGHNGAWVRRIVTKPSNDDTLIACYSGYNITPPLMSKHVWLSTNEGSSWTDISGDLPNVPVHSAVFDPVLSSTFYISTETGVYRTTNAGLNWTTFSSGMPTFVPVDELVIQSGTMKLLAFTHGRSVFETDSPLPVDLIAFSSSVDGNDVLLNWTTGWEQNNLRFDIQRRKYAEGKDWITVGSVEGSGTVFEQRQYSFNDLNLQTGKYEYRLIQIDNNGNSSADHELQNVVEIGVPESYALSQNYPNPFNPVTKIDFSLPVSGITKLLVFDITGRLVATIVNEQLEPGFYSYAFDAKGISSGVYFYRIESGKFIEAKRMLLIK